jgi:methylmalonyl-CoA epimerase
VPGVIGLHHVALAVPDLDAAIAHWTSLFGAELELRAAVTDQGVDAASLQWAGLVDGCLLELVAPLTPGEGGVARFLDKRGAGMHHIAWQVASVEEALDALRLHGVRLIDETSRIGLHGTPVAFVHPSGMGGVLTELVEHA